MSKREQHTNLIGRTVTWPLKGTPYQNKPLMVSGEIVCVDRYEDGSGPRVHVEVIVANTWDREEWAALSSNLRTMANEYRDGLLHTVIVAPLNLIKLFPRS